MIGSWELVEPAYDTGPGYHDTLGPEVGELARTAGYVPDPEQQLFLDHTFGFDKNGKSVAFESALICSRQNLKTGAFKMAALGWLFLTDAKMTVWSAHEFSTSAEAFRDIENLIDGCATMSRRVKTIHRKAGSEAIELMNGHRLKFKARTRTGARGLTGDKLILDEAFALNPGMIGSVLPLISTRPDPQVAYGSSAGHLNSEVLRGVRDRGRRGSSPRLRYLEWCAKRLACEDLKCDHYPGTPGCQLDLIENWGAGNPLLGRTRPDGSGLTIQYVADERQAMAAIPMEFARERMGWWDDPGLSEIFGIGKWEATGVDALPAGVGLKAIGVAVSIDLTSSAIVGAGDNGDAMFMKPLQHGPKTGWLVERCKALQDQHGVQVIIDGRGPGAMMIPHLENAGVQVHVATTQEVLNACAQLETDVNDERLLHFKHQILDKAVGGALKRPVNDRWALGRKGTTEDISPLEAGTLAAWFAGTNPPPIQSVYEDNDLMIV